MLVAKTVRCINIHSRNKDELLEYIQYLKYIGLTPDKMYNISEVRYFGNILNLCIECNDQGESKWYGSEFFDMN